MTGVKYLLSPQQRSFLRALEKQQRTLERKTQLANQARATLNAMIVEAKQMGISSPRIAHAVGVSISRIDQINKESKNAHV